MSIPSCISGHYGSICYRKEIEALNEELVAALEDAIHALMTNDDDVERSAIDKARAIIAKAKGEV